MVTKVSSFLVDELDMFGYANISNYVEPGNNITPALLTLLTAGIPVLIPFGTFIFTPFTLPANGVIFGQGDKSILKLAPLVNSIGITLSNNSMLRNLTIEGDKLNQVGTGLHTIQINGATGVKLIEVKTSNSKGDGLNITGSASNIRLQNCTATGYLDSGVKVVSGNNIHIRDQVCTDSDNISMGAGISLNSAGVAISSVVILSPVCRNNAGNGIYIAGSGSRNVTDVLISEPNTSNNTNNGIYLLNAERVSIDAGLSVANGIDGVRLEGDVQFCRVNGIISKGNIQYSIREVAAGSTPNNNGFIYNTTAGNGTNAVTKLGASSFIV